MSGLNTRAFWPVQSPQQAVKRFSRSKLRSWNMAKHWQTKGPKRIKSDMLKGLASLISTWPFFLRCKQGTLRPQSYATNKLPGELEKDVISWSVCLPGKSPKLCWMWAWHEHGYALDLVPASSALARCTEYIMVHMLYDCIYQGTLPPCRQCQSRDWVEHGRLRPAAAMRQCAWQEQHSAFEVWITLFRSFPFSS